MTRYYFDLWTDGNLTADDEGLEFSHIDKARAEATSSLGDLARDMLRSEVQYKSVAVQVRTEKHHLFSIEMSFQTSQRLQ